MDTRAFQQFDAQIYALARLKVLLEQTFSPGALMEVKKEELFFAKIKNNS